MEGSFGIFRQMAHRLYPPKALGKKRGFGTGICALAKEGGLRYRLFSGWIRRLSRRIRTPTGW